MINPITVRAPHDSTTPLIHQVQVNPSLSNSRLASLDRRSFLAASTLGIAGFRFGRSATAQTGPGDERRGGGKAKSTILFFLCGGASHLDMWDMKPDAPFEYRGPFAERPTSAPQIRLCEHLPMTGKVAHHLAVVRSVSDFGRATGDHHAGYYYNLTGHAPDQTFRTEGNNRKPYADDWPFMGSVVGSRRPLHPTLPQIVTLPHKPSAPPYTRPGQFAGRLGMEFDPFYLEGDQDRPLRFQVPSLRLQTGVGPHRFRDRQSILSAIDRARDELDHDLKVRNYTHQQQRALSLLSASTTASAFDVSTEPDRVRDRYGETVNGMSLLMARRLVEAEVPFITVFWKENLALKGKCRSAGGWDTHGNNFNCLKDNLLPEFDRAYSALIEDLAQRNLLDQTLVLVNSEMGRKPRIGDPRSGGIAGAGRDHWTACMSVLLAGGGVRGGQTFGSSDRHGEYPDDHPLGPEDVTKTVYHAMGITDLEAMTLDDRPFNLLAEGRALTGLF